MNTGKNVIVVAATMLVMCGFSAGANAQDLWNHYSETSPQATPIPLLPRKHALPITPAEEAEGGIIWGAGQEVQIGMSARLVVRGERSGRFIFDVYLRNKTDRTLTIKCPSYDGLSVPSGSDYTAEVQTDRIYCTPSMLDSHGKQVPIDLRPGTDEHQYTLAPGKIVQISRWMLRTANIQTLNTDKKRLTQTAYVNPGPYLMSCSLKVNWDGQPSELQTGKVPFEVQKADVEDARTPSHTR